MAGEFYTPRPVIRFMVEVIDPKIGETVYDPACGTCGFLVAAYEYLKEQEKTTKDREILQRHTFFGQEKKTLPALLGTMNMILHGVLVPNIQRKNTLEENITEVTQKYDIVLTNPPFGGKENKQIQNNFPVSANATELLFLEYIIKKLKGDKTARCGMVVPEGTLFRINQQVKGLKGLLTTLDYWVKRRNKLIHEARGFAIDRISELNQIREDENNIACAYESIPEVLQIIMDHGLLQLRRNYTQQFVGTDKYYIYSEVRDWAIARLLEDLRNENQK